MTALESETNAPGPLRAQIKAHLRERRIRQKQLAGMLGLSEKHVSQLLTGKIDGSIMMWTKIAAALGMRIKLVLVEGEGDRG